MAESDQKPKDDPRKACETKARCPACDSTELVHIRGKVHCKNCHATLETCCD